MADLCTEHRTTSISFKTVRELINKICVKICYPKLVIELILAVTSFQSSRGFTAAEDLILARNQASLVGFIFGYWLLKLLLYLDLLAKFGNKSTKLKSKQGKFKAKFDLDCLSLKFSLDFLLRKFMYYTESDSRFLDTIFLACAVRSLEVAAVSA